MATVYAVIEYLPIGATGVGGEAVLSEHPTAEEAVAAKGALYAQRPELVGCLTIRSGEATLKQKGEDGDARPVASGAVGSGDGARREAGRGGHRPPMPTVRQEVGGILRPAVEHQVPELRGAGEERVD